MRAGPRNLITDVPGFLVGNAEDHAVKTGVSVMTAEAPFAAGVSVMGGAPGTRDTELLAPERLVREVDALVLSGGSAWGLDAASGVMSGLAAAGRGLDFGASRVPIAPTAILFDLMNGGDKSWDVPPYRALGKAAYQAASDDFALGAAGAGVGATSFGWKGGLGSASLELPGGGTVGALVAANPIGAVTAPDGSFWAGAFEIGDEFGARGAPTAPADLGETFRSKVFTEGANTAIAIVATDIALDQAALTRVAIMAQDGFARAIVPSHTPYDGDLIFAASSARRAGGDVGADSYTIGHAAAICVARATARGIYEATPAPGDRFPCWRDAN